MVFAVNGLKHALEYMLKDSHFIGRNFYNSNLFNLVFHLKWRLVLGNSPVSSLHRPLTTSFPKRGGGGGGGEEMRVTRNEVELLVKDFELVSIWSCLVPVRLSPRPSRPIDFWWRIPDERKKWPRRNIEAYKLGTRQDLSKIFANTSDSVNCFSRVLFLLWLHHSHTSVLWIITSDLD